MTKKAKNKTGSLENIISFLDTPNPFQYEYYSILDLNYNSFAGCGGYCDDYMCHHHKISNATISNFNSDKVISIFTDMCDDNDILLKYFVDRIVRNSSIINEDYWEALIDNGYYGEECNGVRVDQSCINSLKNNFLSIKDLLEIEQMRQVLILEYGYLLTKLEKLNNINISSVDIKDIKINNEVYAKKVSKEDLELYKDYSLPRAVCIKEDKWYILVDGYHRILSAKQNNITKIQIIELS